METAVETKVGQMLRGELSATGALPRLELKSFAEKLTEGVGKLFEFLTADGDIRHHTVWGKLIPFSVKQYGKFSTKGIRSLGHCVRPDLVMTPMGQLKVCELDCSPSGRGFLLQLLQNHQETRKKYLSDFAGWYTEMTQGEILYATASKTSCFEETRIFSDALRNEHGVPIRATNIDVENLKNGREQNTSGNKSRLIDRLFYRSELAGEEKEFPFNHVITAEPFLDSKAVLGLIHDPSMKPMLQNVLGTELFAFMQEAVPETYCLKLLQVAYFNSEISLKTLSSFISNDELISTINSGQRNIIESILAIPAKNTSAERNNWLIKTCDVETDMSWGARSVVLGNRTSAQNFSNLLLGKINQVGNGASQKDIGDHAILQRFYQSRNFKDLWEDSIENKIPCIYDKANAFFKEPLKLNDIVHGRVTFFMLLNNLTKKHTYTDVGELTLRNQPLAHGSSDAIIVPFTLV